VRRRPLETGRTAALFLAGLTAFAALATPAGVSAAAAIQLARTAGPQGAPKTIVFRENAVAGKTVATEADGLLQLLFADGTVLTLGPSSAVTIDAFAFEPASGRATLSATLTRGVFRFIGGRTSKTPKGVALSTPFGMVAVEAASVDISLGGTDAPAHFDMVFGSGSVALSRGGSEVARVQRPGYSIVPGTGSASVRKTPADWRQALQQLLSSRAMPSRTLAGRTRADVRRARNNRRRAS